MAATRQKSVPSSHYMDACVTRVDRLIGRLIVFVWVFLFFILFLVNVAPPPTTWTRACHRLVTWIDESILCIYVYTYTQQLTHTQNKTHRDEAVFQFPMLRAEGLKGAIIYYDGQMNDTRMGLTVALTATQHGAVVANRVKVGVIVLYYAVLYFCIVLYCILFYCIVLYSIVLYIIYACICTCMWVGGHI